MRHFLPFHAARGIHHQHHILGNHLIYVHTGRDQQHEESVLACLFVTEQIETNIFRGDGVIQFKIGISNNIAIFIPHHGSEITIPVNGDGMAGGVDGTNGLVGVYFHADALVFQRRVGIEVG